jgi:hypothetical protein
MGKLEQFKEQMYKNRMMVGYGKKTVFKIIKNLQ